MIAGHFLLNVKKWHRTCFLHFAVQPIFLTRRNQRQAEEASSAEGCSIPAHRWAGSGRSKAAGAAGTQGHQAAKDHQSSEW